MERIPIVIDTDPGIDDFFCLALACAYSDRLDLRAVTTMGGNNHTDVTTQNALNILSLFRTDVPVARGADRYLEAEFGAPAAKCHGSNGVGDLILPQSDRTPDDLTAWDKLYEIAKAAQGELVLVTVAPLTNIALALQKHPDLPHWIKKIVMMTGDSERTARAIAARIGVDEYYSEVRPRQHHALCRGERGPRPGRHEARL